ncbi:MAG TPA: inositol 2-dehydrogenase [Sediminispirochaeta sp.]|nr:inositol 2-dehydrogenase [Sediminispirochaeta sp.]
MEKALQAGIIGAGRIGRLHATHLSSRIPGVKVKSISDIIPEAARSCARELDIPQAVEDHRQIMEDREIDFVVVCSSTDTHVRMIKEAAAAGKHIFCEKPIALDLAEIDQALEEVAKHKVKLQVGFNRRFDSNYRRLRDLVAAGEVGEPHILRITSRDPAPPPIEYVKVSGGIFLDMMIHDFDMARFLIGDEVEEVFASGAVRVDPAIGKAGDVDTAVVSLSFRNGAIGTIDNSRQAVYGYDQRAEVFGSRGMVSNENNTPNRVRLANREKISEDLPLHFFVERYIDSYIEEMKQFVEALRHDSPVLVDGWDGKYPVAMGLAALKSLREHRPVKLKEIDTSL